MPYIVGSEIYGHLEKVVDRLEDVANEIHSLVIEHVYGGELASMDATLGLPVLIGLIGVAYLFDFLNGLHDAANSIATVVSTRVLRPHYAVAWAAFFNFVAFLVFGLHAGSDEAGRCIPI